MVSVFGYKTDTRSSKEWRSFRDISSSFKMVLGLSILSFKERAQVKIVSAKEDVERKGGIDDGEEPRGERRKGRRMEQEEEEKKREDRRKWGEQLKLILDLNYLDAAKEVSLD